MSRRQPTMHKSGVRLEPVKSLGEVVRRTRGRLLDVDKRAAKEISAQSRKLKALKKEYRRNLAALMGQAGMRRYQDLRKKLSKTSRSQRIRESSALLDEIGIDRERAGRLQKAFLDDARKLLALGDTDAPPPRPRAPRRESPWVTYSAPYSGSFWSYAWDHGDEASDPVLARHLNPSSGEIGSSIKTQLSGADNDDSLNVEYYTALNVWHTALASGPLEGYLAFEFRASPYSGEVKDEFGISSATYSQLARARLRVLDSQGVLDTQETLIFNIIDVDFGDGDLWKRVVSAPGDLHWYYFRTSESFAQGRVLMLEAGVRNMTWFLSDDESITTTDDLDLRLDRIQVRSRSS